MLVGGGNERENAKSGFYTPLYVGQCMWLIYRFLSNSVLATCIISIETV